MKKQKALKSRSHSRNFKQYKKIAQKILSSPRKSRLKSYSLEDLCREHKEMLEHGVFDNPEIKAQDQAWLNLKPVGKELI